MAGSYQHCLADGGLFTFNLIENMGDAHEACEHMFWLIQMLANGDQEKISRASDEYFYRNRHTESRTAPWHDSAAWKCNKCDTWNRFAVDHCDQCGRGTQYESYIKRRPEENPHATLSLKSLAAALGRSHPGCRCEKCIQETGEAVLRAIGEGQE